MARGVEKRNFPLNPTPLSPHHLKGGDALGDPPRLPCSHRGASEIIEERGLAVIYVPHYRHNRCAQRILRL